MLDSRNRILFALSTAMLAIVLVGEKGSAQENNGECSPCSVVQSGNGQIGHDWTLSCCDLNSPDCYMYPDAQQTGNPGTCEGMHRPCTSTP